MPLRNLNIVVFVLAIAVVCYFTARRTRHAVLVSEAIDLIDNYYVDPVEQDDLIKAAMNGLTSSLDQHSSYFPMDEYSSFQESISQEFAGIGIYVDQPDSDQPVRVITPLVNSPALAAGMLPGDRIVQVDEEDVSKMELRDVSARLKGPVGTTVSLVLQRDVQRIPVSVQRQNIPLESVVGDHRDENSKWVFRLKDAPRIAYIRLQQFGDKTVTELGETLTALDNDFEGLVLDLRGNSGGLLTAARDVSDMFVRKGMIVSTKIRGGVTELAYKASAETMVDPKIPIAVLIDGRSASASEIVAACLQDHERAVIVGTRSYGKGTVQEILPLQYGRSALRLTVARYYRPNNKNIHRQEGATEEDEWGVTPNDGFRIPIDRDTTIEIGTRWREASFPMLIGVEEDALSGPNVDDSDVDDSDSDKDSQNSEGSQNSEENVDSTASDSVTDPDPPESISPKAQANVDSGPEALQYDPPLRAAVGELMRKAGKDSAEKSGEVGEPGDAKAQPEADRKKAA